MFRFFSPPKIKPGDWLIYINDVGISFDLCTTSLKYSQVVKLLEIKKSDNTLIVDVGLRFKDPNMFSQNEKTFLFQVKVFVGLS